MRFPGFVWLLAAVSVFAQESAPPKQDTSTFEATVIPIKTLTGDAFNRLQKILTVFPANINADAGLRTVVVYAPKEVTAQIKKVIAELDRPGSEAARGRNIDATLTFLRGSTKAAAGESKPLPPEVEPVVKQLRSVTIYREFQVWDTVPLRIQEGKTTENVTRLPGGITGPNTAFPSVSIALSPGAVVRRDDGVTVRFENIRLEFRIPYATATGFEWFNSMMKTTGDFKEGQKSVLSKINSPEEDGIFVILALKVLD